MSYAILIISLIVLVYLVVELKSKMNRFEIQCNEIKNYYADLLDPEDLNKIFKEGKFLEENLGYIKKRRKCLVISWIAVVSILMLVTLYLNYLYMQGAVK